MAGCQRDNAPADDIVQTAGQLVGADQPSNDEKLAAGPYAPRDTCGDLKGADAFRQDLAVAVEARDVDALVALAAEDVKLDFGGGAGRAELRKRLSGGDWDLWDELDKLLMLGCSANSQGGTDDPVVLRSVDRPDRSL